MSILLDILVTILSGGFAGHEITKSKTETNISQLFIVIDIPQLSNHSLIPKTVEEIIEDYHQSIKENVSKKQLIPVSGSYKPGKKILTTVSLYCRKYVTK